MNKAMITTFTACLLLAGCGKPQQEEGGKQMTQPEQTVTGLTQEDEARLAEQRAVIEAYLSDDSREKYKTTVGKVGTIRAILEADVFQPDQTYELQCLGVVLGDAFVQELEMEWVMVEDEYGRNPAARLPGTSIILYPLTMISKRIERGEKVDVFDLFNGIADQVDELKQKGM